MSGMVTRQNLSPKVTYHDTAAKDGAMVAESKPMPHRRFVTQSTYRLDCVYRWLHQSTAWVFGRMILKKLNAAVIGSELANH